MIKMNLQLFGGRGASSGMSGGAGKSTKGILKLPDGSTIEFDGTLVYGANDSALNQKQRINIEAFEDKRVKGKIEWAYAVDKDGNPIGNEIRGGKGSVQVPRAYHNTDGAVFTHIHPREDGILGGTFSSADLRNFAKYGNTTVRAKAKEGTYSITKGKNFDKSGFLTFSSSVDSKTYKEYKSTYANILKDYNSGKIGYDVATKQQSKAFNTMLVNLHNEYLAGQKTYGYTYTLESNK